MNKSTRKNLIFQKAKAFLIANMLLFYHFQEVKDIHKFSFKNICISIFAIQLLLAMAIPFM